jgi:LEA14-like dessication related protein
MAKIFKFLPILALVAVLASCGQMKPLTVSKIENVKLNNFSKNSAAVEVTMVVKNPNRLRLKVVDNHLDLYLNSAEMGRVKIKDRIVIPKKSEKAYTFIIETEFSKLALNSIPSLLSMFQTKQVELKLKGDVKVRSWGISKTFPIEIIEKVPLSSAERQKEKLEKASNTGSRK